MVVGNDQSDAGDISPAFQVDGRLKEAVLRAGRADFDQNNLVGHAHPDHNHGAEQSAIGVGSLDIIFSRVGGCGLHDREKGRGGTDNRFAVFIPLQRDGLGPKNLGVENQGVSLIDIQRGWQTGEGRERSVDLGHEEIPGTTTTDRGRAEGSLRVKDARMENFAGGIHGDGLAAIVFDPTATQGPNCSPTRPDFGYEGIRQAGGDQSGGAESDLTLERSADNNRAVGIRRQRQRCLAPRAAEAVGLTGRTVGGQQAQDEDILRAGAGQIGHKSRGSRSGEGSADPQIPRMIKSRGARTVGRRAAEALGPLEGPLSVK